MLPALAIVLIAWGLRLRDGLVLLAGYGVTAAAAASVMLLWWGGAVVATNLLAWATITFWQTAAADARVSDGFRAIAADNLRQISR